MINFLNQFVKTKKLVLQDVNIKFPLKHTNKITWEKKTSKTL